jgi:hypothetical protein
VKVVVETQDQLESKSINTRMPISIFEARESSKKIEIQPRKSKLVSTNCNIDDEIGQERLMSQISSQDRQPLQRLRLNALLSNSNEPMKMQKVLNKEGFP